MKLSNNALSQRRTIALSFLTFKNVPINQRNIGFWMGAKIYSDIKGNLCKCGGAFSARNSFKYKVGQALKEVSYPICNKCETPPPFFRIRAKISCPRKSAHYVFIRHDKGGNRLSDPLDACQLIKTIDYESEKGLFDFKEYDSRKALEFLKFPNVLETYLLEEENRMKRGELTPKGFLSKKSCSKVLLNYFNDFLINQIDEISILGFKNSFTDRLRTRDLCLGELKVILKDSKKKKLIEIMPDFEPIPKARKKESVISLDDARKVISKVANNNLRFMMNLLTVYPVRPSELRAIQWRDIDFKNGRLYLVRHFSGDKLIAGRKSVSEGPKARLDFPITKVFLEYLKGLPIPLNKEEFIFNQGRKGFINEDRLSDEWRIACKKARVKGHTLYEIRHARLTELARLSKGNINQILAVSGHTNANTVMGTYIHDSANMDEFFQ
jgi:integrase